MKIPQVPSLVSIAVLTTITVIFWVLFSVYRVFTTKPPITVPPEVIEPLSDSLDTETIGKIESSVFFDESQIPSIAASPEPSPSPLPEETAQPEELIQEELEL